MKIATHLLLLWLLAAMVLILTAGHAGNLLDPMYLLACLAIGLRALKKSPTRDYISFTLLLWMFSPFVRRLVDWQSGRHEFSLSLIAPLVVTLLAVFALRRNMTRVTFKTALPFFIYLSIVVYGLLLGLANGRGFAAIYAAANWIAPIAFALLILSNPDANAQIRATMTRTLIGGAVVMSIYGAFQFIVAPPWDTAWMIGAKMASIGRPEPFAIRVFSTMNAPGIFAVAVSSAFLLIFNKLSLRTVAAGAVMILGLALSLVRSSWGAVGIGIFLLMLIGDARTKFRAIAIIGLVGIAAIPLVMRAEFFETISSRFETLSSIQDDRSLQDRAEFTNAMLENVGSLLVGGGLGSIGVASNLTQSGDTLGVFDNGWLSLLFTFGFIGLFLAAIVLFWFFTLLRSIRTQPQTASMAVISIVKIALMIFSNTLEGATGMLLFPFLACIIAAAGPRKSLRSQREFSRATSHTQPKEMT
ncbi:O-antigen ligase family protein [Albirhodobacter sp. R86504]|uniref:O-antigen ligase family protein n=1 Tax=Albirhodobacter sp. R86504 TaxID=3093848 RepID=UPI00366E47B4